MKICKICDVEKDISNFTKRENGESRNECKDCRKLYLKQYRKDKSNNAFVIKKSIQNKTCNTCGENKPIDEFIKQKRICKTCQSKYLKEYYENNKEKYSKYNKEKYQQNSEEIKKKTSEYSKNNRDKVNKSSRKYKKEVLSKDPLYLLNKSIGSCIRKSFRSKNLRKDFKTREIIGCPMIEFKSYIESLFLEGMTWENRSMWHLDHIIPISFGENKEEIILLNHFTNFRPMWATDNIIKSDNIEDIENPIYLKILEIRKQKTL
jgi:hypothetical protein